MITLSEMAELARALVCADVQVKMSEDKLKEDKEHARVLREETIPCAMQELGVESIKLLTGETLSVKQEVYASIPAAHKHEAHAWLTSNGFSGLLKTEISTSYARGDIEKALDLYNELTGRGIEMSLKESVHPQTLKAFIKEQLASGENIPLDLFGARPVWTAKIKN